MWENLRIFNMQENCLQQDAGCICEDTWSQALWEHQRNSILMRSSSCVLFPLWWERLCFKKSRLGLKSSFSKKNKQTAVNTLICASLWSPNWTLWCIFYVVLFELRMSIKRCQSRWKDISVYLCTDVQVKRWSTQASGFWQTSDWKYFKGIKGKQKHAQRL